MPSTREQLRRWVAEHEAPARGFAWEAVLELLGQMEAEAVARAAALEAEDVGVLAGLVARRGRVPMHGLVPVPHCMPPEEVIQYRALKALEAAGRLDCVREVLPQLRREADSPALRDLVRQLQSS
ncbi:hypothetical protein JY651_20730 [Pyxidicoccus parkwayensis]|uniref:HEAT repeat domain-containing protein n=1 Tax=Pyxidicoccus parkwayensis TaxID=2813578 RepID=A0ABX7P9J9_9BACT|nr:hypothetical protein [Pyxidicoccus parkwaysis]QSQ27188.1 hypothetical protein JY651_20730 [Pyxidicoccus parkwaysis]